MHRKIYEYPNELFYNRKSEVKYDLTIKRKDYIKKGKRKENNGR